MLEWSSKRCAASTAPPGSRLKQSSQLQFEGSCSEGCPSRVLLDVGLVEVGLYTGV